MSTTLPSNPRHHPLKAAVQILGFLAGIALLVWCLSVALKPENREQIIRLREAEPSLVAAMLALTLASLGLNGLIFWSTIRPVKRIDLPGMLATNALATFLNYLPFKIGVLSRFVIHNRRDHIPVVTIGSWFMVNGFILLGAMAPLLGASMWRKGFDALWAVAALGGVALVGIIIIAVATPLSGEVGMRRFRAWGDFWGDRFHKRLFESRFFANFHNGLGLMARPSVVFVGLGLRLADFAVQTARFMVAARILHHELPLDQAVLIASTFFIIGIASPSGMLGAREGGTAAIFKLVGLAGADTSWLAVGPLLVGAAELIVNLGAASTAMIYLRPDRLLRVKAVKGSAATAPAAPSAQQTRSQLK